MYTLFLAQKYNGTLNCVGHLIHQHMTSIWIWIGAHVATRFYLTCICTTSIRNVLNGAQVRYAYAMNWAQVRYVIHISGFQSISISHLAWQNHLTLIKYYFMHLSTVSNFQLLKIMSESSVCSFIQKTNDGGRNCREQKEKENQWNITFLRKNSCTNPFTCFIGWNLGCAIIMHINTELQAEVRSSQIVNNS